MLEAIRLITHSGIGFKPAAHPIHVAVMALWLILTLFFTPEDSEERGVAA